MPLNERQIKNAKPAEKPFKLNDGKGLYLYVNTSGGKLWRSDFSHNGKRFQSANIRPYHRQQSSLLNDVFETIVCRQYIESLICSKATCHTDFAIF